ncbi:hypothetical protein [Aquihabitans sp. McL0605]|uniref:hypothetical protein n=1 Tax=Aquihabitans sp. McL0605 TaxID=3415671 RepID=UPI003CEC5D34
MDLSWPTRVDLTTGIANRRDTLLDPQLAATDIRTDTFDLPQALSGANAVVFEATSGEGRWAVKCFIQPGLERAVRYQAIASTLDRLGARWSRSVELQPHGIRLPSGEWPLLKMEWADGDDLLEWLRSNLWDQARVAAVAARFATVVSELEAVGIAHGDLQHGNILVTEDDELVLVDYDGMYVPALAAAGPCESGHPAYQPPGRSAVWGPTIDRYSAWIIYGSLVAVAWDPSLLFGPDGAGDDRLLLGERDHVDLTSSPIIESLAAHRLPTVRAVAEQLRTVGRVAAEDLRPLDPGAFPSFEGIGGPGMAFIDIDLGQLDADVEVTLPTSDPSPGTGSHGPLAVEADPWLLRLTLRLVAVAAAASVLVVGPLALLGGAALISVAGSLSYLASRAHRDLAQERMARREAASRRVTCVQAAAAADAKVRGTLEAGRRERDELLARRADVRRWCEEAKAAIDERERAGIEEVLASRRDLLIRLRDQATHEVLAAQQRRQAEAFAAAWIADARLSGIDAALVAALAGVGVVTAADVTWGSARPDRPIRVGRGRGRGSTVELSPAQARVLGLWRTEVDPTLWGTDPALLRDQLETASAMTDPLIELAERETDVRTKAAAARRHLDVEAARDVAEISARIDELRVRVTTAAQSAAQDRTTARAVAAAARRTEREAGAAFDRAGAHGWSWWMLRLLWKPDDESAQQRDGENQHEEV